MGDLAGVEEMFALKSLMRALDVKHVDCREPHSPLGEAGGRAGYLFNATVAGIEQADAILIVGSNPRLESAVLNARIRKVWRANRHAHRGDRRERRSDLSLPASGRRA
jgi:NADH-quinone oxidoreductase subunit G